MALPKRRFSRSRRDKRRTQIQLQKPALTKCTQCGATITPHHICPACGSYRGRQVVNVVTKEKKPR